MNENILVLGAKNNLVDQLSLESEKYEDKIYFVKDSGEKTWNRASPISARSNLLQVKNLFGEIHKVFVFYDSTDFIRFNTFDVESISKSVDSMILGYSYISSEILNCFSDVFYVPEIASGPMDTPSAKAGVYLYKDCYSMLIGDSKITTFVEDAIPEVTRAATKIGSIICTNNNIPPSLDAQWELVDKEFISRKFTFPFVNSEIFMTAIYNGHNIKLICRIDENASTAPEGEFSVGKITIPLLELGLLNIPSYYLGYRNKVCLCKQRQSDKVIQNIFNEDIGIDEDLYIQCEYTEEGAWEILFDLDFLFNQENMLDDFCDKFYWKRIG